MLQLQADSDGSQEIGTERSALNSRSHHGISFAEVARLTAALAHAETDGGERLRARLAAQTHALARVSETTSARVVRSHQTQSVGPIHRLPDQEQAQ